jgi:hypothetical protein
MMAKTKASSSPLLIDALPYAKSREPGNCEFSRKLILGSFTVARLIPPVVNHRGMQRAAKVTRYL